MKRKKAARRMTEFSNYYQCDPDKSDNHMIERFPNNHVKFAAILKPLQWVDIAYSAFGYRAFKMMNVVLKEFDAAAPLDQYLGTEVELEHHRNLVALFCEGIDNNPFLSAIGRFLLKKFALDMLRNRKKVLQYYHLNKEYIEAHGKFIAPIIITGVPRSGTTLLQRLMSEDPNTRSPYTFEMEVPVPPMTLEVNPLKDPRIRSSRATISILSRLARGFTEKFAESHVWSATEMEESFIYMLAHNGIHALNSASAGRTYMHAFLEIEDKRPIFRYERLFFTMLDAYRSPRSHWTLKAPEYAPLFPILFEEYPEVRVVLTHRNPLVVLPSICRLLESWCITFDKDGSFDKHRFGQLLQIVIDKSLMIPFDYRKSHPEKEDRIFDCIYEELFSNPIEMVKRIYRSFNLEYTQEFEERMKHYLKNNKQGKYGRHRYSLAEYGFNGESLYQEYENYMEHYGFGIRDEFKRPPSFNYSLESSAE